MNGEIEHEEHQTSLADYYREDQGTQRIMEMSKSGIIRESMGLDELRRNWQSFFEGNGHKVIIVQEPQGFIVTFFEDNSTIGLVLPDNFELGRVPTGSFDIAKPKGEWDPSAIPVVLQSAKAEQISGKWFIKVKGMLTDK